ncbi:XRE family transcriptional regulator [Apilactobacillus timberlakei]|uniref:helix-turn-helix domain-containing protein n=1 Tax=Apilactobacillus timberlakei TaxID=2008380 RepID=UPI00112C971F|nr:helix-turn-helix transcriptional regulator [Apilactobacillus timberlakei]TPR23189.1 XRE family transcriptional regulator [Apilactobacillus timberlakei]
MKLYEKLKKARKDKKLTQEYVASQINVSRKTISSWENGRGKPNSSYLEQLNFIYDTNIQLYYTHNNKNINIKHFYILYFINLILFILCLFNLFTGDLNGVAVLQLVFSSFFCIKYKINILLELKKSKNKYIYLFIVILLFIIIMNNLEFIHDFSNLLIDVPYGIGAMIHSLILTASFFIITNYRKYK